LMNSEDSLPTMQSNELCVSAVTGQGLPDLVTEIGREVGESQRPAHFPSRKPN
jgi:hypothetical protein